MSRDDLTEHRVWHTMSESDSNMDLLSILLIGLGLSMDATAVAVTCGAAGIRSRDALRIAAFFGGFQSLMPILGWLGGTGLEKFISGFDHWIAFGLLAVVGGRMIYESFRPEHEKKIDVQNIKVLLVLALATSIDALAVGVSLAFLQTPIIRAAVIIGIVTFCLSLAGVYLGKAIGRFLRGKMELIGGLILIGIGIRILIEHLR